MQKLIEIGFLVVFFIGGSLGFSAFKLETFDADLENFADMEENIPSVNSQNDFMAAPNWEERQTNGSVVLPCNSTRTISVRMQHDVDYILSSPNFPSNFTNTTDRCYHYFYGFPNTSTVSFKCDVFDLPSRYSTSCYPNRIYLSLFDSYPTPYPATSWYEYYTRYFCNSVYNTTSPSFEVKGFTRLSINFNNFDKAATTGRYKCKARIEAHQNPMTTTEYPMTTTTENPITTTTEDPKTNTPKPSGSNLLDILSNAGYFSDNLQLTMSINPKP